MIQVKFSAKEDGGLTAFRISGHAGYAQAGKDIVCASVTSAVQLTANTITEVMGIPADVQVLDNLIEVMLPNQCDPVAVKLLEGLRLHLEILAEDYRGTISIRILKDGGK